MYINEFDDAKKEYILRDMYPSRPWMNYSWNSEYVSSFDQFGFGMSRFCDGNGYKKNILAEGDNRLIFIKDLDTKEYYAANRNYGDEAFHAFETRVGMGYSLIRSVYKDIEFVFRLFVPRLGQCECWEVTMKNLGGTKKHQALYAYAELDTALSWHGYTKADLSRRINGVYASHDGYKLETDRTAMFFASNREIKAYETSNRRFKGVYSDIDHPEGLSEEKLSCMGTCFESQLGAALQFDVILEPGETEKFLFLLGSAKNEDEAEEICGRLLSEKAFEDNFAVMTGEADDFSRNIVIETPDRDINRMANIWLKRQMELGMQWGRLYGKGFRDIMQDTTAFLPLAPEKARERIIYSARYQRKDGNPVRQWDPIIDKVYADGAVWLIYAVNAYIKETGDIAVLDEMVPYFDSDVKENILKHCMRGFDFLFGSIGEHGLCLWLAGDWNDAMDACGTEGKGESVWLSEAAVKAGCELADILSYIGDERLRGKVLEKTEQMKKNICEYGRDGKWFIYGINDKGDRVGSHSSEDGQVFLNPQTWAVLAGIVTGDEAVSLMDAVEKRLGCSYGYVQNSPSYTRPNKSIGRITYFEKGLYENGSVYNHGAAFKAVADCVIHKGDRALRTLKMIFPSNPVLKESGSEPYAMPNMYFGPENPCRKGDAPQGWITGTSGWVFRCITENILGIKAEYDGLRIEPDMPDLWNSASASRIFRGALYNIAIKNSGSGEYRISVDGKPIEGNIVPAFECGSTHCIVCER